MKILPRIGNLVVLRDPAGRDENLLRLMVCNEPFESFILGCLREVAGFRKVDGAIAVPKHWAVPGFKNRKDIIFYQDTVPVYVRHIRFSHEGSWFCVSDGRFFTLKDNRPIYNTLVESQADVVAVNIVPQLRASYEKVLTASQDELVGFRLFYEDAAQSAPIPRDWPHHLFIRKRSLDNLLVEGGLPLTFDKLLELCFSKSLVVHSASVGGSVLDLATENGLLCLLQKVPSSAALLSRYCADYSPGANNGDEVAIATNAKLFGRILLGKGVTIGENAIVVGPTILGNDVKIGRNAVVRSSLVGSGVLIQTGELVEEKVLTNLNVSDELARKTSRADTAVTGEDIPRDLSRNNFREWPKFSYAGFGKRILDIIVSVVVLVLFAPILPVIMLVIKLTSPGPVFFKDVRQGLKGNVFKCLKFRTMQVGSDRMQERLRVLNQVDGPQFMMEDDPRMSAVGEFLRATYIDEIPQFINVLLGEMSVVGPRPSPESENRLCPFWRDARLSVRPGITGLWQIRRMRQPMKDFQEWIHYDIRYVRDLSLKQDLWISWLTAKKMAAKFISQF